MGTVPNELCYEIMKIKPPVKPYRAPKEIERGNWRSGELQGLYHDWLFHVNEETIFDCDSGGKPHQHCMDILVAEKMDAKPGSL